MSDLAQETDRDLITMTRKGRVEAFQPLVERHWFRVACLVRKSVRDPQTVEDLCQETFLRAFEKLGQFDVSRPFAPWLLKIAYHYVCEFFRRRGRELSFVPLDEGVVRQALDQEPSRQVLDRAALDECLDALPPSFRIAFVLRHGLMLSYEEMAGILDEPLGTVKITLFRARKLLQDFFHKGEQLMIQEGSERS